MAFSFSNIPRLDDLCVEVIAANYYGVKWRYFGYFGYF